MFTYEHHTDISYLACASQLLGAPDAIYPHFVHQLADAAVPVHELLISPLRLEPQSSLPLPPDLFGGQRANSTGLDLTVPAMRAPLLAAYASILVPHVAEFDAKLAASAITISATCYKTWSKTTVTERASIMRHAADALQAELPRFCALLVKEAGKTWNDAVGEGREAVDFLPYYAWQAERIMQCSRKSCPAKRATRCSVSPAKATSCA